MLTVSGNQDLISMMILLLSIALMLFGYNLRRNESGPWLMLLGTCSAMGIIAFNILKHTNSNFWGWM